ncbi:LTA synthase family protein [Niabella sp. CC-SYL272]|uniref:LTA synthase family protein n=1 Tax=Niabella agricola TaxID=2891571 RepID=UPI001F44DAEE|nr:LTA synthase family protein [Niabella agricola]MCF3111564.1 LTA synthase family protein [Niabella agricola]
MRYPHKPVKNESFLRRSLKGACKDFVPQLLVLAALFLVLRLFEAGYEAFRHGFNGYLWKALFAGLLKDLAFVASAGFLLYLLYFACFWAGRKFARVVFIVLGSALCLAQLALAFYFQFSFNLLGGDLWQYKLADIRQTVGAAGVSIWIFVALAVVLALIAAALAILPRRLKLPAGSVYGVIIFLALLMPFHPALRASKLHTGNEYADNLSANKSYYFYSGTIDHFNPPELQTDIYSDFYSGDYDSDSTVVDSIRTFKYVDETKFPFLRMEDTPDQLSPFFNKPTAPPDLVVIIVEGLGSAFAGSGARLGSFTPFFDSLSRAGLYWENCLSTSGRTFSVLPGLLASLPFARSGFAELGASMPPHVSLFSLLQHNGYKTAFYYGGDAHFDNMDLFMQKNHIGTIRDLKSFPAGYRKLPAASSGFSWGYGDKELFRWYLASQDPLSTAPKASVLLTVATHSPFLVNDQETYFKKFEQRLAALHFPESGKQVARNYRDQYASILYADDALKDFFTAYSKRSDFARTIFLVTGDHQMPELPLNSKIDRYHVPLLIYSPLLSRMAAFSSMVSHFDVAPSLLAFLRNNYPVQLPSLVSWIGSGLDTSRVFRNVHAYPMMQDKNDLVDFIEGTHMVNMSTLFEVDPQLNLVPDDSKELLNRVTGAFDRFKRKNQQVINGAGLIPDSIYHRYATGK